MIFAPCTHENNFNPLVLTLLFAVGSVELAKLYMIVVVVSYRQ